MRVLELFSGTGSVSKVCKKLGYEVVSVDISNQFMNPTHLVDILKFNYKQYKSGYFDIIWASPPCRTFSSMKFLTATMEEILKEIELEGLPPLKKTLEIIKYFKPKYYFIENPANSKMKNYLDLPNKVVSYCQYGYDYQKNTRIWTNKNIIAKKCSKKTCKHYGNHPNKIGTTRKNQSKKINKLYKKYSVPQDLIIDCISI